MHIIEIKVLDLDAYVTYKVLTPTEVEGLRESQRETNRDDYRRLVLETIVSNLGDLLNKLKAMPNELGSKTVETLYNGAVMLNPGIDIDTWVNLSKGRTATSAATVAPRHSSGPAKKKSTGLDLVKISKPKFMKMKEHLKSRVIGQDQAIEELTNALKRAYAGLSDPIRPNGVFIFAGESGVGKTFVARELHKWGCLRSSPH
jgi:ATP-dependent Clp protease ATP-binding subunit ClpA